MLVITSAYSLGNFADMLVFKLGKNKANLERSVYYVVLGIGVLALIILLLGISGLVYPGMFWGLLSVLNILSVCLFVRNVRQNKFQIEKLSTFEKILVCAITLIGMMLIVVSFRPVTSYDALSHLLLLPKSYIFKHAIYNLTSFYPSYSYAQLITMLDMAVLTLSDEVAVNHLHLMLGFLTCAVMYAAVIKTVNRTAALLTVLTIMTSSVFFDMAVIAKIDIGIALYSAVAIYCLINWRREKNNNWFILAAVFCACSFGVKYNGGLIPVFAAVFYLYDLWEQKGLTNENILLAFTAIAVYAACVSPWLGLNYSFTGNPVSPFLASFFNDSSMPPSMRQWYSSYFREATSGYFTYLKDAFLGMPVLFFVFFADFRKNKAVSLVFISGALYLLSGDIFFLHADRIFLPAYILFDLVIAYAVYGLLSSDKKVVKYSFAFIYFAMIAGGAFSVGNEIFRKENLPYFSGAVSKAEFLQNNVSCYQIAEAANKLVPRNEKILSLADHRGYYFDQLYVHGLSRTGFSITQSNNPKEILEELKKNNIQYIVYCEDDYFKERQPAIFNSAEFRGENFSLMAKEGKYSLLKLRA